MRLVTVKADDGKARTGVLEGERVFVTDAPGLHQAIVEQYDFEHAGGEWRDLADVRLVTPLRPLTVFCLGQNYRDHLAEKAPIELKEPEFFLKAGQTVAELDDPAVADARVTAKLDYETELGIVI